jgi:hypothetical protein
MYFDILLLKMKSNIIDNQIHREAETSQLDKNSTFQSASLWV